MKKKLLLVLAILFTATSIFGMKIYLTNTSGSGQAQANPNASLGGYRSTTELSATSMKNLFDDVSIVEALLGDTEYRMIDIYNDAATDALRVQFYTRTPTSSPDTALTYGYSATAQPHADSWNGEALANESTAPASPSMSFVDSTKTSPLAFGTIPAGSSARVCVKRVVSAGSAWTAHDIGSFGVRWGGAAAGCSGSYGVTTQNGSSGYGEGSTSICLIKITGACDGNTATMTCRMLDAGDDQGVGYRYRFVIYSDNAGTPANLLGWVEGTATYSNPAVSRTETLVVDTNSTTFWIGVQSEQYVTWAYGATTGGTNKVRYNLTYGDAPPSTFTGGDLYEDDTHTVQFMVSY